MRSTSMTPLPDAPTRPDAMMQDDDGDDIILVSENIRTPRSKAEPSSLASEPATPTTPSPSSKRRRAPASTKKSSPTKRANHDEGDHVKQGKKEKRSVDEDDDDDDDDDDDNEHKDERAISAELQAEKKEEDDKKAIGEGGKSHRKLYQRFNVEEDRLIVQQLIENFDAHPVKEATNRAWNTVMQRMRVILKAGLRNLHGEEHAFLPGEKR